MRTPIQPNLELKPTFTHGGARVGAGRPRKHGAGAPHSARARVTRHHPAHVTLRLRDGFPSLRGRGRHRVVERALAGVLERAGFGLNAALKRSGAVFRDRYHARALRTPTEARHALCYVLQNYRRHVTDAHGVVDPEWIDPLSSGAGFDGWSRHAHGAGNVAAAAAACTSPPSAWLLTVGWRRRGLIGVDEVPSAAWA